ncbi:MAG: ferrochelatase [Fimbriimonas sp.]
MNSNVGLLVMHYGTPATMEDVLPYYTHIRRGRPPSPEQLHDLTSRYEAIGGPSPLTALSRRQAEAIQAGLHKRGIPAKLYIGTKHAPPFVSDAVTQMAADEIDQAIGIVLAPHFSTFSIAAYKQYALGARDQHRPEMKLEIIERWGTLPALIQALAHRVNEQMNGWSPEETLVIFSAHSLPEKIVAAGDPYKDELEETSRLVAEASGLKHWTFAFQSASNTGEPWLGPDILDVIQDNAGRYRNIIACTVGFVSDHLEVLYDLGIEAREKCEELGLNFRLAATINDDSAVMDALAELCATRLANP